MPFSTDRKFFGISRSKNGGIVYKAAAEEIYTGEAEKVNGDTLIIGKGKYISLTVKNYMKDLQGISSAFKILFTIPNLDPIGYCIEWYVTDKDVKCIIILKD